ncbi:zinc finger protein 830 isoform X1 [Rhincodon typus]|uniref:zinc finger protein 830 isoform X1 n=1 Tax=Rhincodon typus TaxID=259920 RepID=UPI00202EC7A1|nr:zinc finger protein 830 isoform X1 [Rhincodon typus]
MAAPGKGKKKVVDQQELRRLMREKQRASAAGKRIDSPLAKYNSLGHLSCVLCSTPIKSELLWQTHILGKQHKENLEKPKTAKQTTVPSHVHASTVSVGKRKVTDPVSQTTKKVKAFCESTTSTGPGLPPDFINPVNKVSQQSKSSQHSGLGLAVIGYEEDSDGMVKEAKKDIVAHSVPPAPMEPQAGHGLPADFFDSTLASPAVTHSGPIQKPEQSDKAMERKDNTAEALPEGFFDDPVKDAKVRNVDPPKDQMDKEWEEFQKEIRQVNTVSEAIVAEDDEEIRFDRQIEEIDEQIMCYKRIEHLRDRQETVKRLMTALKSKQSQGDNEVDTDEEEEFQEFLSGDWRAKGALL